MVMKVGTWSKTLMESRFGVEIDGKVRKDGDLIAEAHRDTAAFVMLYRRHYDAVFRYCVHRLFERDAAEDVTSDVFLSVVKSFGRFEGSERQFRSWLYKIATNRVNEHLRGVVRRNGFMKTIFEQADNLVVECNASADAPDKKAALLKEAMLKLKPKYQTIITLRFFEGLKLTEIAEVLGSSDGTVRSWLARAMAKLRKQISYAQTDGQKV